MPGKLGHVMDDAQLTEQETVSIPDTVHKKLYLLSVHIKTKELGSAELPQALQTAEGDVLR